MPGRGFCYIENLALSPCGHFVASATLNRNEFRSMMNIKARLDAALMPEEQALSLETLPAFPDAFPEWRKAEQAA